MLGVDLDVDLVDRDAGFPAADGFDGFAHQVWGDAVGGPVEVQVQVAAEFRAVWVAGFWGGEDDAQGLVDVAQALDDLAGGTECGLPVGGGDAGVGDGRCHALIVRAPKSFGF